MSSHDIMGVLNGIILLFGAHHDNKITSSFMRFIRVKEERFENKKSVKNPDDFRYLTNGNRILGTIPTMQNSVITFNGHNNIIFCEQGVILSDSNISFNGNNSIVYLSQSKKLYHLVIAIYNNNVCFIGKNNYFNGATHIALSEHKHVFIGDNCLFSMGVWIRNADPHLIYNIETGERRNSTKSVFVGDHVWIGQSAILLKGTKIDSGSVVGAMSVVSGMVEHNSIYCGNPARKVRDSIFWDGTCVHDWTQEDTDKGKLYSRFIEGKNAHGDAYIFEYDENHTLTYETLDDALDGTNVKGKLDYLVRLNEIRNKNRFVH